MKFDFPDENDTRNLFATSARSYHASLNHSLLALVQVLAAVHLWIS